MYEGAFVSMEEYVANCMYVYIHEMFFVILSMYNMSICMFMSVPVHTTMYTCI